MTRRTKVTPPEDEAVPTNRLVFGRDTYCRTCKGKGTKIDGQGKNQDNTCLQCRGTGITSKSETTET